MRWKTSLHSSNWREIRSYFESGYLSVHSTWSSKLRVPLTYLWLIEASSWGVTVKLAFLSRCSKGIGLHLEIIWCTRSSFGLRQWSRGSSRLVTVFLGTLWSSIKEVKPPFVFDVEHRIALEAMQGNRASSCIEGGNLWFYSSCSRKLVVPFD